MADVHIFFYSERGFESFVKRRVKVKDTIELHFFACEVRLVNPCTQFISSLPQKNKNCQLQS